MPREPLATRPSRVEIPLSPAAVAAVFLGVGQKHEMIAVPGVALAAGEVLVEIELATVCGSDVHTVLGDRPGATMSVLGHEYVGKVIAVGSAGIRCVDGSQLRVDDRIVWSVYAACLKCDRCKRGMPQKCRYVVKYGHERIVSHWELNGGFASHIHLLAGTTIAKVPDSHPGRVYAPAACGTATSFAALRAAAQIVDIDDAVVLVSGAGLIGLTVTAMSTDGGASVIVADPDESRRALARRFGAAQTIDPAQPGALEIALAALKAKEVAVVVEASGARSAVIDAVANVGVGGVVILVGSVSPTPEVGVDPEDVVRRNITIRGIHNYADHDLEGAVRYLNHGAHMYPFAELVGEIFPLDKIDDAIAKAAAGTSVRVGVRKA